MNLTKLTLKNFLSHHKTELDLTKSSVLLVTGNNGVGKSSLVRDSVTWALFGAARNSDRAGDQLITNGAPFAEVQIEFQIGENQYTVIRGRNRDEKSYLSLFRGETELTGETIAETQALINRMLGVNYTTFSQSVCIEQGKLNSFSSLTPKEAKKVFYEILNLEKYETYEATVRDYMRIINNDLITYQSRADVLEQQAVPLEGAEDKLKAIDDRLESLEASKQVGENKLGYLKTLLKSQKDSHQKKLLEARLTKEKMVQDLVEAEQETFALSAAHCPTCKRQWEERLRSEYLSQAVSKKEELQTQLPSVEEELTKLESVDFIHLENEIAEVEEKIKDLDKTIGQVKEKRGYISSMFENQTKIKEQLAVLRDKAHNKREELVIYKYLSDAFGRNGIPTLIMSSAIEELQVITNGLLDDLSNSRLKVEFQLEKELKTGGVSDTLQINVYDGANSRPYHNFSGGERARIDLAIRLGLSVLLAHRNNFQTETLIIDEALESLDEEGRLRVSNLFHRLSGQFKKIIAITHTDLKDRNFETIEIIKENGISKIRGKE